jgi:hypothetical protein
LISGDRRDFRHLKMASIGGITETIARMSVTTVSIAIAVEQQGGAPREIAPQTFSRWPIARQLCSRIRRESGGSACRPGLLADTRN